MFNLKFVQIIYVYLWIFLYRKFARVLRKPHDVLVSIRRRTTITRFNKTEIKDKNMNINDIYDMLSSMKNLDSRFWHRIDIRHHDFVDEATETQTEIARNFTHTLDQ